MEREGIPAHKSSSAGMTIAYAGIQFDKPIGVQNGLEVSNRNSAIYKSIRMQMLNRDSVCYLNQPNAIHIS